MKRTLSVIVALVMLLTLTPAFAAQEEINIFMWSDYISDDLIANFEDEYGVRVNLSYMSDNADSITKLTAGRAAIWSSWICPRFPIPRTSTGPTGPNRTRATVCPIL